jgi:hypothetical protein
MRSMPREGSVTEPSDTELALLGVKQTCRSDETIRQRWVRRLVALRHSNGGRPANDLCRKVPSGVLAC